jgi:hypothetical protein
VFIVNIQQQTLALGVFHPAIRGDMNGKHGGNLNLDIAKKKKKSFKQNTHYHTP